MSPARKRQLIAVIALLVAGGALAFVASGVMEKNIVYYLDVTELLKRGTSAENAPVRLGGVVQKGSLQWDAQRLDLGFQVGMADTGQPSVHVASKGSPPQMFREGIGVVVEGRYDGQVFTAERLMVKHSNEYKPPGPGEHPQNIYRIPPGE
jgi:cytochrome c-type biogenesis protein CcmE